MEEWKPIRWTSGEYEVSDCGNVRKREENSIKIIKPNKDSSGYLRVRIGNKSYAVHRMVAQEFIPNPYEFPVVHHIDEDKENNKRSNLIWCTYKQNNMFSVPKRSRKQAKKRYVVVQMDLEGNVLAEWNTFQEAKRALGISDAAMIGKCAHGMRKSAHGYKWGLRYNKDDVLYDRQSRIEKKRYAQELFEEAYKLAEDETIEELKTITLLCSKKNSK